MLGFWIKPYMGLDAWFGNMKKHKVGEMVVNKKKLLRVQSFWVMLRFWIKPCMSLDAWFGSMKKHEEGEIVVNQSFF
jgi:hypothetical protein